MLEGILGAYALDGVVHKYPLEQVQEGFVERGCGRDDFLLLLALS